LSWPRLGESEEPGLISSVHELALVLMDAMELKKLVAAIPRLDLRESLVPIALREKSVSAP
jgi:hypothetical protein